MTKKHLSYFDVLAAKKAYTEGKNITELLHMQKNTTTNTPEIIETAYEIQAGSYIDYVKNNPRQAMLYSAELAEILDNHIIQPGSLLDIGTGELTMLSLTTNALTNKPTNIYAFDISWSRLYKGKAYAKENMGCDYNKLEAFVADISEIPLPDKSINVTTSSHALEPNGGKLKELMVELFRITIDKLILFEPCFEINTEEGKQRMKKLGYIKNIDGVVEELGGIVLDKIIIKNTSNPLNPTVGFVITPPTLAAQPPTTNNISKTIFTVPGTNYPLKKVDSFYFSNDTGFCYPVLKSIPIFKSNLAILATSLCE